MASSSNDWRNSLHPELRSKVSNTGAAHLRGTNAQIDDTSRNNASIIERHAFSVAQNVHEYVRLVSENVAKAAFLQNRMSPGRLVLKLSEGVEQAGASMGQQIEAVPGADLRRGPDQQFHSTGSHVDGMREVEKEAMRGPSEKHVPGDKGMETARGNRGVAVHGLDGELNIRMQPENNCSDLFITGQRDGVRETPVNVQNSVPGFVTKGNEHMGDSNEDQWDEIDLNDSNAE